MTVIPELRAEVLRAAEVQASAEPVRAGRLRSWIGRGGLPLVVALVVGTGGIATATGLVVSQADREKADALVAAKTPPAGPVSRLGAQMVQTAKEVQAELPYPPGMRDTYDWSRYSAGATLGTGGETRREIQPMSETRAACLWKVFYLRSRANGNRQGMRDAARVIAQAPDWPATRRLAGNGASADEPSSWNADERAWAQAAAAGQATDQMRHEVEINCFDHTKAELTGKVPLRRQLEDRKRASRAESGH